MLGPKNTARDVAATLIAGLNDGSIELRQAESGSGGSAADLSSSLLGDGDGWGGSKEVIFGSSAKVTVYEDGRSEKDGRSR